MMEQGRCDGMSLLILGCQETVASVLGAVLLPLGSHSHGSRSQYREAACREVRGMRDRDVAAPTGMSLETDPRTPQRVSRSDCSPHQWLDGNFMRNLELQVPSCDKKCFLFFN